MNIYAKLTILCIFLVIFTSGVLFFLTSRRVESILKGETRASATQQSRDKMHTIEQFIFSRLNDLKTAAKNPYFGSTEISANELTKRLQELEDLNDLYYSFSFFNNERIRIADSKRLSIGKQHSNSLYWEKITPETDAVMDISKSESVGKVVMHFAARVEDATKQTAGILVGRVLVDELYKIMGDFYLSNDSTRRLNVALIDRDGTLLYSNQNNEGALVDKYEDYALVQAAINGGSDFVETEDKLFFISKGQGYLNYSGNAWTLILSIPKENAYLPLSDIRDQLLLAILPVLIVAIIFALVAANVFVRPIVRLSRAAEEIGKGNLSAEIPVGTKDEVGKLATHLGNAAQTLIRRIDEQKMLNQKLEDQKNEIQKQKVQIESVNQQVVDSINYAQRIQRSILPDISNFNRLVSDAFVFYQPKDVVSGDFYWFEKVRQGRDEYLIIACADCTGHGVPGAIMSIMGSNQLTNIIYYQNYMDPRKILARIDKVIKFELQREKTDTQNPDGMEIGICVINLEDLKMEFSGAGIPLYLSQNGKVMSYKSPKFMIGGMDGDEREVEDQLTKEVIQLSEGDKLYLASDGFQDQFGGPDDRKFMVKNFRNLIEEISSKDFKSQREILEQRFNEWKKETPQTDDVLVIGIEV